MYRNSFEEAGEDMRLYDRDKGNDLWPLGHWLSNIVKEDPHINMYFTVNAHPETLQIWSGPLVVIGYPCPVTLLLPGVLSSQAVSILA